MDLWIRTQDKTCLLKVDKLDYYDDAIFYDITLLGRYKSKERALEVLNEIQKILCEGEVLVLKDTCIDVPSEKFLEQLKETPIIVSTGDTKAEYIHKDIIVYEMPKE